jgi:hypothetical protein
MRYGLRRCIPATKQSQSDAYALLWSQSRWPAYGRRLDRAGRPLLAWRYQLLRGLDMDLANLLEFWSGTARGWAERDECALTAQNRFVIGGFVERWSRIVDQSGVFLAFEIDCLDRRCCLICCAKNPAECFRTNGHRARRAL